MKRNKGVDDKALAAARGRGERYVVRAGRKGRYEPAKTRATEPDALALAALGEAQPDIEHQSHD